MNIKDKEYDITVGSGLLDSASKYFNLDRRVLVVTDSGVPSEYSIRVASGAKESKILTVPEGEGSKSLATLEYLLKEMSDFKMGRGDCAVAVGGGVVGDLTGFAASCYMRGIDFYNVPTTLLSQVDSSIGGKTAINLGGIKNIVGAFHQPKGVLIDTDALATLPKRQLSSGLAESVKMALSNNAELFSFIEGLDGVSSAMENIEHIIIESLKIKRSVVEADEREHGLRKILNLGHTLGHGIEAGNNGGLYHGECVALGMLPVVTSKIRKRLSKIYERLELPTEYTGSIDAALDLVSHDKKLYHGTLDVITVKEVGACEIIPMTEEEFSVTVRKVFNP